MNIIVLGCIGGLLPDILRLIKAGNDGVYTRPDYLKQTFFYVILIFQITLGGFIVYITNVKDNMDALVYGYAAPQIFTSLAAGIMKKGNGGGDDSSKKNTKIPPTKGVQPFRFIPDNDYRGTDTRQMMRNFY